MQQLAWQSLAEARAPAGLVAAGAVAQRLLARLALRGAEELAALSVVATRDLLVILGAAEHLPWVDGVQYCAPDAAAPALWLPTHAAPALPADLVAAALSARAGQRSPVLLWPAPLQVLPLDRPSSLTPQLLAWLGRELAP